jgi:hypothetical protein
LKLAWAGEGERLASFCKNLHWKHVLEGYFHQLVPHIQFCHAPNLKLFPLMIVDYFEFEAPTKALRFSLSLASKYFYLFAIPCLSFSGSGRLITPGIESFFGLRLKRCFIVLIETVSPREALTDAATRSLRNITAANYHKYQPKCIRSCTGRQYTLNL